MLKSAGAPDNAAGRAAGLGPNAVPPRRPVRRDEMTLGTILLIIVILLLIGAIPAWPHSRSWGYGPSGGLGLVLVILLILFLLGKI
jgi:hypothetical protein